MVQSQSSERMSLPADRDEFRLMLARAFDLAWNRYYAMEQIDLLSEENVRTLLATHLVAKAREGVQQESELGEAGLQHLLSLSPRLARARTPSPGDISSPPSSEHVTNTSFFSHLRIDGAHARFVPRWRVKQSR
jgi:hypothetical protein